jgi:hypothetical protein
LWHKKIKHIYVFFAKLYLKFILYFHPKKSYIPIWFLSKVAWHPANINTFHPVVAILSTVLRVSIRVKRICSTVETTKQRLIFIIKKIWKSNYNTYVYCFHSSLKYKKNNHSSPLTVTLFFGCLPFLLFTSSQLSNNFLFLGSVFQWTMKTIYICIIIRFPYFLYNKYVLFFYVTIFIL